MHLIHLLPVLYLGISSCQSDLCFFLMEKRDWHVSDAILVQDYRKQIYFYFHNFGLSKKVLWIFSLLFDLLLFFAMMILAYNLR